MQWTDIRPRREPSDDPSRCAYCGRLTDIETMTVHRPGQPSVIRTMRRCRGRSIERKRSCPADIVSEEEIQ